MTRMDAIAILPRNSDSGHAGRTHRPHEAIAWNRPAEVHAGLASPTIPNFEIGETLPKSPDRAFLYAWVWGHHKPVGSRV